MRSVFFFFTNWDAKYFKKTFVGEVKIKYGKKNKKSVANKKT